MKNFLGPLIEFLHGKNIAVVWGKLFFFLALLWVIFGFLKMLFIVIMTVIGYFIGVVFFRDLEVLRSWLDKFMPPGLFR